MAIAMIGVAISKGRFAPWPGGLSVPANLGDVVLAAGAIVALLVPVILARHWKTSRK